LIFQFLSNERYRFLCGNFGLNSSGIAQKIKSPFYSIMEKRRGEGRRGEGRRGSRNARGEILL
jgi:hypothetical protein